MMMASLNCISSSFLRGHNSAGQPNWTPKGRPQGEGLKAPSQKEARKGTHG